MAKQIKMTDRANHLIQNIKAGKNRIFYFYDLPAGWVHILRAGYAVREGDRAILTEAGWQYAETLPPLPE